MHAVVVATLILILIPIESRVCDDGSTWTYDTSHTGMAPDCPPAAIWNEWGYLWHSVDVIKAACERHPTCNIFVRYGYWGTCDTCYGHGYAHVCPDLNNITWIPETRWGHGASIANNYQLDCIPGPTMEPTPQPTPEPTNVEQFPCVCYETVLMSEMSDGVGNRCYEYEVSPNPNPPAGANCGQIPPDMLEYVVLGQGRADHRCGLTDISSVVSSISFEISNVTAIGGISYDFSYNSVDTEISGMKIGGTFKFGVVNGISFTICYDETQVSGTLPTGRIAYRQKGVETVCEVQDTLPNLCPPRRGGA